MIFELDRACHVPKNKTSFVAAVIEYTINISGNILML
jgi:hypothetical protein